MNARQWRFWRVGLWALLLALGPIGCGTAPLRGGKATTVTKPSAGVVEQTVVQSENPAAVSKQTQETVKTRTFTLPAGSSMVETHVTAPAVPGAAPVTNATAMVISAPMAVVEHDETHAATELGAAQKDTARELSAKLASLRGIVWVGVALFLLGLATLFYPPLKLIVGSVTTSCAMIGGGLALMILPSMVVGNELLILGCVLGVVAVWFFAYRHGNLRGLVASLPALASSGAGTVSPVATAAPPAAAAAPPAGTPPPGTGWNRPA